MNNEKDDESGSEIGKEQTGLSRNLKLGIIILIVVLGGFGVYTLFKDDKPKNEDERRREKAANERVNFVEDDNIERERNLRSIPEIVVPKVNNSFNIGDIKAPTVPQLEIPQITVKVPEKPKIDVQKNNTVPQLFNAPNNEQRNPITPNFQAIQNDSGGASSRKRNAPVLMLGGGGESLNDTPAEREKNKLMDLISGKSYKRYTAPSSFAKVTDSYVGLKDRMLLAGKMIEIVLETRINTAQEGMMRAMVSSDVYSESGYNILIPAGSRVIGSYKGSKKKNLYTVEVLLSRIVRPDGIDILLGGMPITDKLGGMGVRPDRVFTGLGKAVMNSVLVGALSIGALAGVRAVERALPKKDPLVIDDKGRPLFDDRTTAETTNIVNNITENLKTRVEAGDNSNEPIFVVNQGRALSIMTNKDIVFTDENAFVFYPGEIDALKRENCSTN